MKRRLIFAGAALSWLVASIVSLKGQGVMKEARVTQVVKDVKILPAQAAPRPATLSDTVRGDTAVRTGVESRAELTFGDLTIARLGANTIFSFNEGTRTVDLNNGAILLRVPKGSGGTKIQTAAVTAAITGTTVIAEYHPKSYAKYLVLEGTMRLYLKGVLGESVLMHAGQMMILNPNTTRLSEPVDFDLERLLKTSLFIQGFRPLASVPLLADVQRQQLELKAAGELIDTNLVIFGRGTLVTMTDPQSSDVIDRKTAAVTLPTPTATATSTPRPTPTASPSASPTPAPTPSKFGTPPPIVTFVPYPIDNGTALQTDPAIARAGVTDFGKIYRDSGQDGPFSAWAFTATTPFDNTAGIDTLYSGNVPLAALKFTSLQLVGNPTISTANGGATNLALISVGPITSAPAGNTTFTFTGMQSVLIATQNGSITLSGIGFQNIPLLFFYARGATSTLALGAPIANSQLLRLMAENNIAINAPESLFGGANGGTLVGTAGGGITVNSPIDTPTAFLTTGTSGNGGMVTLSALGGTLTVNSRIQTSYNDPDPSVPGTLIRRSAQGGPIALSSSLTTGTGINVTSGASLLSLLNAAAPGPPGAITLFTTGSDIVVNNATLQADRGSIGIAQTAGPSAGTAQITLNGGTFTSESLFANSRGNLSVGTTSPVNISAVSLTFVATNDVTWSGGTLVATASRTGGNVTMQAGGNLTIAGPADIERFNGGVFTGINALNILLSAGTTFQANGTLRLVTDASGLTGSGPSSGNISLTGGTITLTRLTNIQTGPTTGDQNTGSNITLLAGGPVTVSNMSGVVTIGAGRTLGFGGNVSFTGASFTGTGPDLELDLRVNNSSPGVIVTGGNVTLKIDGSFTTAPGASLNLEVNNTGGTIQNGGNINATIGGTFSADLATVQIDNSGGFLPTNTGINFSVVGATNVNAGLSFEILNSPGGTFGSNAFINVTLANANVGNLTAFIDSVGGKIGGTSTVTLQINGTLAVTNRIDVLGSLTSTSPITANQLSATNVSAPSITVGSLGITRFSFPTILNEITINPLHTITTNALISTGGINFNGPDAGTTPGGSVDGGFLTINVPSLSFGASAADNIQGAVTFNGGATPDNSQAPGNGGVFTVNATGNITVNSPIEATTGQQPSGSEPNGTGGTVNLNSTGGTISVAAPITVSSADAAAGKPRRHSQSGGNINLTSNRTGAAINISNTGQLLSLLEPVAAGPGGKITILATATGSSINVTGDSGSAGTPPSDTIRADKGTVDIRNTGAGGSISLTTAQISADTVKIAALGSNGTLSIGSGRINADTLLQLYATGSNGTVVFVGNALLSGNSMKIIAGNTVTVNNGVVVQVSNNPADIYVSDINHANYSNFNGGNSTTTGVFIIEGTSGSPVSGANTHPGVPPPPFGVGH
ncbi:MAG: FecR domain-containing protein [Chthoniobacterales bacterium]